MSKEYIEKLEEEAKKSAWVVKYLVKIYLGDPHNKDLFQGESRRSGAQYKEPINREKAEKLILSAIEDYNTEMIEILLTHPVVETMPGLQIAAARLCKKICDDLRPEPPPNIRKGNNSYSSRKTFVAVLASYGDPEAILALERCGFTSELWQRSVSNHSRTLYEHINAKTK